LSALAKPYPDTGPGSPTKYDSPTSPSATACPSARRRPTTRKSPRDTRALVSEPRSNASDHRVPERSHKRIRKYDRMLEVVAERFYPETRLLGQVQRPRSAHRTSLRLGPRRSCALRRRWGGERLRGACAGQGPVSRAPPAADGQHANELLGRPLMGCAHYSLGPFGEDSDLRGRSPPSNSLARPFPDKKP
jgi:hypothetical protein